MGKYMNKKKHTCRLFVTHARIGKYINNDGEIDYENFKDVSFYGKIGLERVKEYMNNNKETKQYIKDNISEKVIIEITEYEKKVVSIPYEDIINNYEKKEEK